MLVDDATSADRTSATLPGSVTTCCRRRTSYGPADAHEAIRRVASGINVGGRNKVAMADLRKAFEDGGYQAVRTYIQSGNVLFESGAARRSLEDDIERVLEARFGVPLVVVVRSHDQLRDVVDHAPDRFGAAPGTYHSDVVFLKAPLTAKQAMRSSTCARASTRPGRVRA